MGTLIKRTSKDEPELMTVISDNNELLYAAININVCKTSDCNHEWESVVLPDFALENIHNSPKDIKKNVLIAHIIKAFYDDNAMIAIVNNYLSDMENTHYKREFNEMQKVRKLAKETVNEIINKNLF